MSRVPGERERGAEPAPKPSVARSRSCSLLEKLMQLGCLGRDESFP